MLFRSCLDYINGFTSGATYNVNASIDTSLAAITNTRYGLSSGSFATNTITVSGGTSSSYVHTGVTVGVTYYYQVAAIYTDLTLACATTCLSAYSSTVFATPVFTSDTTLTYTGAPVTYTVPAGVTWINVDASGGQGSIASTYAGGKGGRVQADRKSTRLNSSHEWISRMPSSA